MATTTTTTARGTQLPCPCCGERSANIDLHLADATFGCTECGADFTADDVRHLIARWARVLAWLDALPVETD